MKNSELKINEQSIKTELNLYKDKPYNCLFEYIWNSFDAGATQIKLTFKLPNEGIGYVEDVKISDNGSGWDFDNDLNTETFLSSSKHDLNSSNKTLPKGKFGRGRYAFIWIAEQIEILSKGKKLTLEHNTNIKEEEKDGEITGTEIKFLKITPDFSTILSGTKSLQKELLLEFGWFLCENENYQILVNNEAIDINKNIKESKKLEKNFFEEEIRKELDENFVIKIILWEEKPSEYSKYYFLNESGVDIFKQNTGLNKKSDNFWHSVYIKSSLFKNADDISEEVVAQQTLDLGDKKIKKIKKQIIQKIKEELIKLRKPYLVEQSDVLLEELKEEKLIPNLSEFGIYDEESYGDLLKTIYTITPSLFVGKSDSEKKFICATFAGLLSTQDDVLIKTILEQLQELTEDEKQDLLEILRRTSLSNAIKTIKEIDHRLEVLEKLKILISEHEKETLEVKHIQKILDQNFWLFGEQFRLFVTTEGALKNVLVKYAKEILEIEDPELQTEPNGEVDLFLTKLEDYNGIQKNIIIELKRASIVLTEGKEYKQINDYRKKVLEQSLCNGENQYWEFYLIGKEYDQGIKELIENAKQHGEKDKGLSLNINDGKVKIYVRKWSDILEVEWGTKMKHLKEKLQIEAKKSKTENVDEIVREVISN
ncbi:MAG: hypothetical protein LiPW41_526 [Parcubacteria group bacterium LiPW_41]|nr:MAG: hypothetical protein LiPW41_526 [Parcubacteria group bacterium LiPW_41]